MPAIAESIMSMVIFSGGTWVSGAVCNIASRAFRDRSPVTQPAASARRPIFSPVFREPVSVVATCPQLRRPALILGFVRGG
jgi:hypothetical protein